MFVFCYKTSSSRYLLRFFILFFSVVLFASVYKIYVCMYVQFLSRLVVYVFDKKHVICGSVVVMVAMCNIMLYKIVPLSSGHRTQQSNKRIQNTEKKRNFFFERSKRIRRTDQHEETEGFKQEKRIENLFILYISYGLLYAHCFIGDFLFFYVNIFDILFAVLVLSCSECMSFDE